MARNQFDITAVQNAIDDVLAFGALAPLIPFGRPEVVDDLRVATLGKPQQPQRLISMRIDADVLRRLEFGNPEIIRTLLAVHCNGAHADHLATLAANSEGGRAVTAKAKRWIHHLESMGRIAARQRSLINIVTTS